MANMTATIAQASKINYTSNQEAGNLVLHLLSWPDMTASSRPWTRWWWPGSAVDRENLTNLLAAYRDAGLGGVEITPIYGVKGSEDQNIAYMSETWLAMLQHTLDTAEQLGLGVDLATTTGWPIGGPMVPDDDAEDRLVLDSHEVTAGSVFHWASDRGPLQALTAVNASGEAVSLLDSIMESEDSSITCDEDCVIYSVTQKFAGRMVKRAAPGGEGKCINPFYRVAVGRYFRWFVAKLADIKPGAIRSQFHDSFEYLADWAPDLLDEFEARRGYDLRLHLHNLAGAGDPELVNRVKTDYRETISDMLLHNFTRYWTAFSHTAGSLTRNQAHGSPGNLLDLYAAVDIPETEMFGPSGNPHIAKFASSAAHVRGNALVSSETCTWLAEHFHVTLDLVKSAIDQLFLSGVNHIFYHGTCYSPAKAEWPGWLFYASTTFAPQDPIWQDFPLLNEYVTRCQLILQAGRPGSRTLLYWPLHDLWQARPDIYMLEINGSWLKSSPAGTTAEALWKAGFDYDWLSDRQLAEAHFSGGQISLQGGGYDAVLVPPCHYMPDASFERLMELANDGAQVIFVGGLPADVPGYGLLDERRENLQRMLSHIDFDEPVGNDLHVCQFGAGKVLCGSSAIEMLALAGIPNEPIGVIMGAPPVRRVHMEYIDRFVVNRTGLQQSHWVTIPDEFLTALLLNPLTGDLGEAAVRSTRQGREVYVTLDAGSSIVVRTTNELVADAPQWQYLQPTDTVYALNGDWRVEFLKGGEGQPESFSTTGAPTYWSSTSAAHWAGTARYECDMAVPSGHKGPWQLEIEQIAGSARVLVDGVAVGNILSRPFTITIPPLSPGRHKLSIDVTSTAANRIRQMDLDKKLWKIFHDINMVDIQYKPLDASNWLVEPAGLNGSIVLRAMNVGGPR